MSGLQILGPAIASKFGVLSADTSNVSASTTLVDSGLQVAIGASSTEIWLAEFFILVSAANATMDAKFGLSVPASCTAQWGTSAGLGSEIAGFADRSAANTKTLLNNEGATTSVATGAGTSGTGLVAVIFGGGTAGNVKLQFAQNTSDAGNLKLLKGSSVRYVRLQG